MKRKHIIKALRRIEDDVTKAADSVVRANDRLTDGSSVDEQKWDLIQLRLDLESIEEDIQDVWWSISKKVDQ